MNRIERLIEKYCPEGVEFKKLKDIGFIYGGLTGKSKSDFINGNAKYITYSNIYWNIEVSTDIDTFVKIKEDERQNIVEYGDVLFTASSETPDECGMSSVLTEKVLEPLYLNSFSFGFRLNDKDQLLPGFLKYLFRDLEIRKQINKTANGVTRYNISKRLFEKIQIPIPPLFIQKEIVNILDKFTQLEAELETELEARRKQYEFYLNQLMEFEGKEVERKALGEVCLKTENIKWKENENTDYSYIDLTSVSREDNRITDNQTVNFKNAPSRAQQIVLKDDVIFGTTRPTLKRVSIIPEIYHKQICSTGFCVLRANQEKILSRYLYFILKTSSFNSHVEINQKGASYPSISDNKIKQFKFPIPPLSEQERIVSILDQFDALVNDTTIGLQAEIDARRKQYEYYRNKLLTFAEYE